MRKRLEHAAALVGLVAGVGSAAVGVGYRESWAQSPGVDEEVRAKATAIIPPEPALLRRSLRFQTLDRTDGLPLNTVSSIVQDRAGFMWIGTADGLARWDGQRFVTFRTEPGHPKSISSSWINRLLLARDGALWIATEGGGLNRYRPDKGAFDRFEPANDAHSLHSASVVALSEGPDGRIWIGTQGGGLAVLDPASGKVRSYSTEDGARSVVNAVLAARDGTVWIGTDEGLYRFDSRAGVFEPLFQDSEELAAALIRTLTLDRSGRLWIGTEGHGLARYAPASKELQLYQAAPGDWSRLSDNSIRAVYEDRSGRIWVGTTGALHLLDPASGRFERQVVAPEEKRGLPDSPTDIYQDKGGVLWIATFNAGAALLDPLSLRFHSYNIPGSMSGIYVHEDDLWVGTSQGVCRWRGLAVEGICYKTGRAGAKVFVERGGTLWLGTIEHGLYRLDPQSSDRWTIYRNDPREPTSIGAGAVLAMHQDRRGTLWVGQIGGGLRRFDRAREQFLAVPKMPSELIYDIKDDPVLPEVLWIGTADIGLLKLNLDTGDMLSFTPQPDDTEKKTDNAVVDFLFDGDKVIWLATFGGGLKRLDRTTGAFKTYGRAQGMPSDTLYALRRDASGALWLSSTAGLARFNPRTEHVDVFTAADGLQSDEFTQTAAYAAADGRFYFGGVDGIDVFRPQEIDIDRYRPPMALTSIEVLGDPYAAGQPLESIRQISLDHDEGFVAVQFAALSFSGSKQIEFEYRVPEESARWLRASSGVVSLAGLDSGDYTLMMRARNRHGVTSEPIVLGVTIAPPPWRTWWAYSLYGAGGLALLWGIYAFQRARIIRLQKMARLWTVERELAVTAAVQSWFLPEASRFSNGQCEVVGFYRAADICSGDWWWYEFDERGKLWLSVADVTGHGAGSAMLTAAVAMGLRVQPDSPHETMLDRLSRVNREVLVRCKGKAMMSMTTAVFDQNSGHVIVHGVGGLPALLMRPDGTHVVIGASGTPIGSAERLAVGQQAALLRPGDRLIITTDGIIETMTPKGRPIGLRRFVNLIRDVREMPLQDAAERIVHDVDLARAAVPQEDDFTFCMLERRG
jgi:ligand-binding sensor domain-containing protein